jgi:hypothetical protein
MTEDQARQFNNNPADPTVPGCDTTHLASSSAPWLRANSQPHSPPSRPTHANSARIRILLQQTT